jgi:hypothetical protein
VYLCEELREVVVAFRGTEQVCGRERAGVCPVCVAICIAAIVNCTSSVLEQAMAEQCVLCMVLHSFSGRAGPGKHSSCCALSRRKCLMGLLHSPPVVLNHSPSNRPFTVSVCWCAVLCCAGEVEGPCL